MRLSAIRLRDVGPFRDGLAVEGLSGGLDVLIAPNEAGKSTMFRAVETVFFAKHTGTSGELRSMASEEGGTAVLEADFEAEGGRWRITKTFGRKKSARLEALDGGGSRHAWTGPEAETRLADLIGLADRDGGGTHGPHGFLWVGQRGAIDDTQLSPEVAARSALKDIVEREVASLSGTKRLQQVRDSVAGELQTLVTASKSQPRGPWLEAIRRRDDAARVLADAKASQDVAAKRVARITALSERRMVLSALASRQAGAAGGVVGAGSAGIEDARQAWLHAEAAVTAANDATRRYREAVAARQAAAVALREAEELVALAADIARLEAELHTANTEVSSRREAYSITANRIETLSAEQARLEANETARRYRILVQRLSDARGLSDGSDRLAREGAANMVTTSAIEGLRDAVRRRERAEDALAAALPRVTIAYEAGAGGRILRDGQPLADGEIAIATADGAWPIELDIPGIGRIVVDLPAESNRVELEAALARARDDISAGLASAGLASVDDAEAAAKRRAEIERQLADSQARLDGIAPDGLAVLAAEVAAVAEREGQRQRLEDAGPEDTGREDSGPAKAPRRVASGAAAALRSSARSSARATRTGVAPGAALGAAPAPDLFSHVATMRDDVAAGGSNGRHMAGLAGAGDAAGGLGAAAENSADGAALGHEAALADVRAELAVATREGERQRAATDEAALAVARLTGTLESARARLKIESERTEGGGSDARGGGVVQTEGDVGHAVISADTFKERLGDLAAALRDRVREEVAFRDTLPSAQAMEALLADRETWAATLAARERELQEVDLELQRLLGMQEGAGAELTAGDIERLAGDLAGAEASVATYEDEAGGLALLRGLLDEAIGGAQDRLLEPVMRRLEPYLADVFPDAALDLDRELSVTALARGGQRLAPMKFSGGTAEQIAILVRLAYGRVLAENGQPTPVILDDALVYTDDARLAAIFRCLTTAARHHQVLVLSCQDSRFAALPGKRLRLKPWDGPAT